MTKNKLSYIAIIKRDGGHTLKTKPNLNGLEIHPQNQANRKNQIQVEKMTLISDVMIERMMEKKINRRFTLLLKKLNECVLIDNDTDAARGIRQVMDETEKFKAQLRGRYQEYVNEQFIHLTMKKMEILEQEISLRIYMIQQKQYKSPIEPEKKSGKSR